jgi:hypothetical protein
MGTRGLVYLVVSVRYSPVLHSPRMLTAHLVGLVLLADATTAGCPRAPWPSGALLDRSGQGTCLIVGPMHEDRQEQAIPDILGFEQQRPR